MAIPSRFTKVKIAAGYTLLLVVLLFSLLFVHREMEKLSDTDDVKSDTKKTKLSGKRLK